MKGGPVCTLLDNEREREGKRFAISWAQFLILQMAPHLATVHSVPANWTNIAS